MEPRDMPAFTARIKALCAVFQTPYSPELDNTFFRVVRDLDVAAVNQALDLLESMSKFMPKPVDLRAAALAAGNPSIAQRCPPGARLFPPGYSVSVEGHGVVVKIGEFGGFAVRKRARWIVYELTGSTGDGKRELWSGAGPRDA